MDVSFAIQSFTSVLTTYWDETTNSEETSTEYNEITYLAFIPGQWYYDMGGLGFDTNYDCTFSNLRVPSVTTLTSDILTSYYVTSFIAKDVSTVTSTTTSTETVTSGVSVPGYPGTVTLAPTCSDETVTDVLTITHTTAIIESVTYNVDSAGVLTIFTSGPLPGTSTLLSCF